MSRENIQRKELNKLYGKAIKKFIGGRKRERVKKLNLGCGENILKDWDNADFQKEKGINMSFDFEKIPYPIKDNTYDIVLFDQVIEHLSYPKKAMEEIHRICKPNALVLIGVVYYNNKGAFTDITHKSFFSDRTFINYANQVNMVTKKRMYELIDLKLIPTKFGKLFPKNFRRRLSSVMAGIIRLIYIELRVLK